MQKTIHLHLDNLFESLEDPSECVSVVRDLVNVVETESDEELRKSPLSFPSLSNFSPFLAVWVSLLFKSDKSVLAFLDRTTTPIQQPGLVQARIDLLDFVKQFMKRLKSRFVGKLAHWMIFLLLLSF